MRILSGLALVVFGVVSLLQNLASLPPETSSATLTGFVIPFAACILAGLYLIFTKRKR